MPPVPHRSRKPPARRPGPANLLVSPLAFWLGVAVIALLTVVSFEVGYLLGKPRRARPESAPEVAAAPATPTPAPTPPPKKTAPTPKPSAEPAPSAPTPPGKKPRQESPPAPGAKPEPQPKPADPPRPPPKFTFAA